MADVYDYINETGVIVPDAEAIQTEVQQEYLNAFGSDLNLAPNTPQGILITLETLSRIAMAANNATLANQINPNQAGGIFLDALLALTGSARTRATHTLVDCTLAGVVGTIIPAGAQIADVDGNLYELISQVVIPTGGSIANVPFQSVLPGSVPGVAGTLTVIVSNILGWESVTNPNAAVPGVATQSDVAARALRLNTLAAQGMGLAEAITSALYLVDGVTSLTFRENTASIPMTIDGVDMAPHSLYTCVGGDASLTDIAQALTDKKSGGCGYNNGLGIQQEINITNQYSGQVIPVLFDTPSMINIQMDITVHPISSVQNIETAVKNAILAYAAGGIPNEPGFAVGLNVSPFQIAGAVNILVPGLFVQEVQIGKQSFTQQGNLTATNVLVTQLTYNTDIVPGMTVTGVGIPNGTTVASLVGPNGLNLSNPATITGMSVLTFTENVVYQTTEIPIEIWQQGTTSAPFINVTVV